MAERERLNARRLVGNHHVLLMTLDTLRFDVAQQAHRLGETPTLSSLLASGGWEPRHAPGNFTFASHQAMFAGFLPTPISPGTHPRLFAATFPGSETTSESTWVFEQSNLVDGLRAAGYHTVCIGGVGFFNQLTELGRVLPSMFDESHWDPSLGVTDPNSTRNQVNLACTILDQRPSSLPIFLFVNVSALHQPNCHYLHGASVDSVESQRAALAYVDIQMATLLARLREHGNWLVVITSDHGTAYGEDGYVGHRLAHPVVWTVPYLETILPESH